MNPQMRRNASTISSIIDIVHRAIVSSRVSKNVTFRGSKNHDVIQIQLFSSECYLQMARGSENVRYTLCITKNYLLHEPFFCLCSRFPRATGRLTTRRFLRFSRARRLSPCTFCVSCSKRKGHFVRARCADRRTFHSASCSLAITSERCPNDETNRERVAALRHCCSLRHISCIEIRC